MPKPERLKRPGLFLPLRLTTFVILFAVVVLWMGYPQQLATLFVLYSVFTLIMAVFMAVDKRYNLATGTSVAISAQFLSEILIESGVIYATGNINSPLSALFLLTIVSAALAYRLVGTLLVASMVSLAYSFIIWLGLGYSELPASALESILSARDTVFYSVFFHILIFYLVAFISGYLAERLKDRDRQLADTSRALQKAKLETDDILRHLNSGLLTVDAQGRILFFNRAAEKILGYREEDVKGMRCEEVFAERMPELAAALVDGMTRNINYPRKECEIVDADRQTLPLGLSTSTLTERGGGLRGVIAIFSDLTEAKRLEAKVRVADRLAAIGELSASIAHEIRNPLAAISGSVEVLKNELHVCGENARLMDLIVKESDRLSKTLSEFLLYARIDRPVYNKVELCHLVNEVIQVLYHHPSFHSGVNISLETDESIVYVVGDEDLIKQLLLNLAVNACESFAEKGNNLTFRLAVNSIGGKVELYVQDDGPGIGPDILKKIYQPFFSTKKEGTGLGLAIVHRVCTALKLDISVDSQVGEGTTFMLEFETYQLDKVDTVAAGNVSDRAFIV